MACEMYLLEHGAVLYFMSLIIVVVPFELRVRYIKTTLPYYTEIGHSNLNP